MNFQRMGVFPISPSGDVRFIHSGMKVTFSVRVRCDVFPVVVNLGWRWWFSVVDPCTRVLGCIDDQEMKVNSFSKVLQFVGQHSA